MVVDFRTFSGCPIYITDPWASEFTMEDVRRGNINQRRYIGGIDVRLVTHSLFVASLAAEIDQIDPEAIPVAAVHDQHETVTQDMVTGIKLHFPNMKLLETMWEARFLSFFGIDPIEAKRHKEVVKLCDLRALLTEMKYHNHGGYPYAVEANAHKVYAGQVVGEPTLNDLALFHELNSALPEIQWIALQSFIYNKISKKDKNNG